MNKDEMMNKIGCGIIAFYNKDVKEFNDYVDKLFDKDLYTLYEMRKSFTKLLHQLVDACKDDEFLQGLIKFRGCFLNALNDKIYARELQEKYDSKYYEN